MDAEEKKLKVTEWQFLCYKEEYIIRIAEIERAYNAKKQLYVLELTLFGAMSYFIVTKFFVSMPSEYNIFILSTLLLFPIPFYFFQ